MALDETSISETPVVVRTWARKGETPMIKHSFNWKRLSVMILASPCGKLKVITVPGSFVAERVRTILMALLEVMEERIILLWDGAPIHRAKIVQDFLEQEEVKARLHVVQLPAYAPDLNPVELINSALKRKYLGNFAAKDLGELHAKVHEGLEEWEATPEKLAACFRHALGTDFSREGVKAA